MCETEHLPKYLAFCFPITLRYKVLFLKASKMVFQGGEKSNRGSDLYTKLPCTTSTESSQLGLSPAIVTGWGGR